MLSLVPQVPLSVRWAIEGTQDDGSWLLTTDPSDPEVAARIHAAVDAYQSVLAQHTS